MSTEVICALISVGGALLSALISYGVSRSTANKEVERMRLTWEREDVVSSDDEFAAMSSSVAKFVQSGRTSCQQAAMAEIAAIRSKESGNLAYLLDDLYFAVQSGNIGNSDVCLTKVIDEKRDTKRKQNTSRRNKPMK